jgi:hypothetical protein
VCVSYVEYPVNERSQSEYLAYPFIIRRAEQVSHLPFIGPKIESLVRVFDYL